MKQTPIQELTVLIEEVEKTAQSEHTRRIFKLLSIVLAIQAEEEVLFARDCFNAGANYGRDSHMATNDGMPIQQPNFDKWFKRYSKQKK